MLAVFLFRYFGKYGLYCAVIIGIVLANLQGGKVTELTMFGHTFNASMGAILYSGIYFSTDLLNERYGKSEANRAVMLGFIANIAVLITLLMSLQFIPSNLTGSALEIHDAVNTLANYSPYRAIVCKGVTIGENSIIGAGAVVTKDVPPNSIFAGI